VIQIPLSGDKLEGGEKNMKASEAKIYDEARIFVRPVQSRQYSMRDELERLRNMPRVIKGNELRWTGGPQLWHKTLIDPHNNLTQSIHIHYVDLAPRAKSQKHGHQNEALCYILEGKGYEIHDGKTYEWNAGDLVLIHGGCVHQHFNADPDKPARGIIIKSKPLYMFLNLIFQAQVERAPKEPIPGWEDYKPINLRELL
jgi:quercetin dioxygenase-like cupin family protein